MSCLFMANKRMIDRFFLVPIHAIIGWIVITCLLLPLLSACTNAQTPSGNAEPIGTTSQTAASTATAVSNSSTSTASTSVSGGVMPINTNITYASVEITIVDVKQAKTFADEKDISTSDVLRLDLKETNPTASTAYCDYSQIARMLLPDGTSVAPLSVEVNDGSIGASIARTNWVDFPMPLSIKGSQTTLKLGKDTESQEIIPLVAGADVTKYQAKSVTPNAKMTYGKIDWTITTATSELSYGGKQADKGMMFVVVELNADNAGSSSGGGDLVQVRLKSGETMSPAQEFLGDVAGNQTNVKSTLSFIMPQGGTAFTLIFLPSNAYGITTQSSVDFQLA